MPKPIKRDKALQPVSREHHHGLRLSLKIRKGLSKNVAPERIKNYANWFWHHHLVPHFEMEEKYIFPVLGAEHELIIEAVNQHQKLESLFTDKTISVENLSQIEKELTLHIRFEEQVLFNEIQDAATPEQLTLIEEMHSKIEDICWVDEFWD